MSLSFKEYQYQAAATAIYPELAIEDYNAGPEWVSYIYPALGLCGEAGEVAEKVKKLIRDKGGIVKDEDRKEIAKELGDVCWYLAALCREFRLDMGEVAQANLDKLAARKAADTLSGSGDNR